MKNNELRGLPGQQEISLQELWRIAMRKKWIIIGATLAVFILGMIYSFLATPMYTAHGQLLIDKEPNILSFQDIFNIESFNDDYFQTQYKLLQSRTLAGDTIDRMRLHENGAFVKDVIGERGLNSNDWKKDPRIRAGFINMFLERLIIRPVKKTRLIEVSFIDKDPAFAAEALNSFFDAYIEMNIERKYQATEQATDFLANQIVMVQAEIEQLEGELQEYGKLGELNKALTDAQIERVNKEAYYNEIAAATPDFIPDAMANPLIQKLREEYSELNREYVKKSELYLPNLPEMQNLKTELDSAKKALEDETQDLIKRAYSDYQSALNREQALAVAFNRQKREAFQLNSNAIEYNSLQIQIQNQKNLLESLMKRKSETDVSSRLKALRTSNIWIVDKAEIPSSPTSPNKQKNMAFAFMIGLLGGLGLAFVSDRLDNTVKSVDDIQTYSEMPMLGMVPEMSGNGLKMRAKFEKVNMKKNTKAEEKPKESQRPLIGRLLNLVGMHKPESPEEEQEWVDLIVHFSPKSTFSEYYRSIRTSILLSDKDSNMKVIAVMSPLPQEGKTATVSNLGIALAQAGKKVVIIDADLRKPRLHNIFNVKNSNGLTKYLKEDLSPQDVLQATAISTLFLINAGPEPPNPVEMLGSERMTNLFAKLKETFDFILVDTPPMLGISDAIVLGPCLDGVVLVVRAGKTPRRALKQAQERLDAHKIKGMGIIINHVQLPNFDYYYTDSYYKYYRSSHE
jgi:succinoglycan biosynthesis transport protein ExoP